MPPRAHRILIPLAALLAVLPILIHGPTCGHDFDFHLLSWLEASAQFAHFGFPHWAYTPAWNAGEPRFIFYPPISWTLGGLLGLILPWSLVPAAFTWISLTLSGFTAHRLARQYAGESAALVAAIVYPANPYMLFTAYERTAYGELLAAAFMPLLFQAALAPRIRALPIAIPIALLWLTNAPAAVMGCYALAFLTLMRLALGAPSFRSHRKGGVSSAARPLLKLALTTTAGLILGLLLATFYILPAAYERKYVQTDMAVTTGMTVSDHFLFHNMAPSTPGFTPADIAFHDSVVRTASLVSLTILTAIALAFLLIRLSCRHPERSEVPPPFAAAMPLAALTLLIAFLLTPPSALLWRIVPQLHFLQFPWRLCALLAVILCIVTAQAFHPYFKKNPPLSVQSVFIRVKFLAPLALAAALIFPAWHFFEQPCDDEDNVKARVALFHSNLGTEPTDEYTPADADPDALAQPPHTDPPYWLTSACHEFGPSCDPDVNPPPNSVPGAAPDHLMLTVSQSKTLILNRRAYPAWHITINGETISRTYPTRQDGLIDIPIPPGTSTIDLHFDETPDRIAGIALSLTTLTILLASQKKWRSKTRTLRAKKPGIQS